MRAKQVQVGAAEAAGNGIASGSAPGVERTIDLSTVPTSRGTLIAWVSDHVDTLGLPAAAKPTVKAACRLERDGDTCDVLVLADLLDQGNTAAQGVAVRLRALAEGGLDAMGAADKSDEQPADRSAKTKTKGDAARKTARNKKLAPPLANVVPESMRPIPFSRIEPARYNRSFGMERDPKFDRELRASIQRDGLLAPIILRPKVEKPGYYERVTGDGRDGVLREQRGPDGCLQPGEFVVRTDLDSAESAIRVSVSENEVRRAVSPYEKARQAARLVSEENLTQEEVGQLLGEKRETVGALVKLVAACAEIPTGWQDDLKAAPGRDMSHNPAITPSHWRVVAPAVGEHGVSPELTRIMERARRERWSVRRLEKELSEANLRERKPRTSSTPEALAPAPESVTAPPAPVQGAPTHPQPAHADDIRVGIRYLTRARAAFAKADQNLADLTLDLIQRAEEFMSEIGAGEAAAATAAAQVAVTPETDKAA